MGSNSSPNLQNGQSESDRKTFHLTLDEAQEIVMWAEGGRAEYGFQRNDKADEAIAEMRRQLANFRGEA